MANIKSSEKANRQRITRTARNIAQKTAMRTVIKRLRAAIGGKKVKEAQALLKSAVSGDRQRRLEGRHQARHRVAHDLAPDRRRLQPQVVTEPPGASGATNGHASGVVPLGLRSWSPRSGAAAASWGRRPTRPTRTASTPAIEPDARRRTCRRLSSSRWSTSPRCFRPAAAPAFARTRRCACSSTRPRSTGAAGKIQVFDADTGDAGRQHRHRGAADVSGDRRAQLLLQADHHQRQRGVHLPAQGAEAGREVLREHRSGRVPRRARAARRSAP